MAKQPRLARPMRPPIRRRRGTARTCLAKCRPGDVECQWHLPHRLLGTQAVPTVVGTGYPAMGSTSLPPTVPRWQHEEDGPPSVMAYRRRTRAECYWHWYSNSGRGLFNAVCKFSHFSFGRASPFVAARHILRFASSVANARVPPSRKGKRPNSVREWGISGPRILPQGNQQREKKKPAHAVIYHRFERCIPLILSFSPREKELGTRCSRRVLCLISQYYRAFR
jgi:hypothetical protein